MKVSIFLISFFSMQSAGSKSVTSPAIWQACSDGSNLVIRLIPDLPAHRAFQVFSTPVPSGVIRPKPVTTTRLLRISLPIRCVPTVWVLNILFDVVHGVLHGQDLLGLLVRDFDFKRFFKGHHQFDGI